MGIQLVTGEKNVLNPLDGLRQYKLNTKASIVILATVIKPVMVAACSIVPYWSIVVLSST